MSGGGKIAALLRILAAWAGAVALAYSLASILATQSVVARLANMGAPVGWDERLAMSFHDLGGMSASLLPLVAIGFAIALPLAGLLSHWRPQWRTVLFALAGGVALVTVHLALRAVFDITPVAVARSIPGLASQALAGFIGGYAFAALRRRGP